METCLEKNSKFLSFKNPIVGDLICIEIDDHNICIYVIGIDISNKQIQVIDIDINFDDMIKNTFKIIFGLKFYPGESIYKKIGNLNLTTQKPIENIQIDGENLNANDSFYEIKLFKGKLQLISPN